MMRFPMDFTEYACAKLRRSMHQIAHAAAALDPADVWRRPNDKTNSVGNLILHLTGNVRQWINASIGGEPFNRDRRAEFAQRGPLPPAEIIADLERVVQRACQVIAGLSADGLGRVTTTQGYEVTVLVAVFHVVEHFSYHTGQIVYATKAMKACDLSLYDAAGHLPSAPDSHLP